MNIFWHNIPHTGAALQVAFTRGQDLLAGLQQSPAVGGHGFVRSAARLVLLPRRAEAL